ncbi:MULTISPECIES: DUF3971 domain-containing protein [Mesorhizobium]|uniref:YhdP central domain-containing protein n=1 Tax=Mesorhizobium denitrificans TaxID=2294114 RepID=A0A371X1Z2_9HYPH|nr:MULTISPECIES: DUF3971 domain-containing protein [Mesorhizobium]RFC63242.1 hypothetical protein DY251_20890 [Mesorhizobium denitrificans]
MTDQAEKHDEAHEKIRFRKEEIVDLSIMPSAEGIPFTAKRLPSRNKVRRWVVRIAAIAVALVLGFLAFLQLLGISGFGAQRLTEIAQTELRGFFGPNIDAAIGHARFSVQGPGTLTLDLSDVKIAKGGSDDVAVGAETLRLRLNTWSLLIGKPRVSGVRLENAHVLLGAMPGQSNASWLNGLINADGLLDPDKVVQFAFDTADNASRVFATGVAPEVEISKVRFELPEGLPTREIAVESATFSRESDGVMLRGVAAADGHNTEFDAQITSNPQDGAADKFMFAFSTERQDAEIKSVSLGKSTVSLKGQRAVGDQPEKLEAIITGDGLSVDLGTRGVLAGKLDILATLAAGTGKLEFDRFNANIGNSSFKMSGAIGPQPPQQGKPSAYRFELVSPDSTLAPTDSDEPPMQLSLTLGGNYSPGNKLISVDNIGISSASGRAFGNASLQLADGPPGIELALDVAGMSVSHVKQLWPWFSAGSARRWVNENLFGGTVPSGSIRFAVVPGRLGNGQKLNQDEVSGHFQVSQTRFDIVGLLPPVRDADGTVSFAGDDVDITLQTGKVFLSDGKTVSASEGTLTIDDAGKKPVIGDLQIKIAGDASAVAELASLEPINAMKNTGIAPASLSGAVDGMISAKIPMHKGIDKSLLNWDVDLNFKNLAVAQKVEGQTINGANGTIALDKEKAIITAKASLNGLPAELTLTEPIGGSDVARDRDITLVIDEDAQEKLSPGLDEFIAGTIKLDVVGSENNRRRLEADLTGAKLNLPMVGWTKGEGIPAKLAFNIETGDNGINISNFDLSGATFGIEGDMSVADGGLRSAKFSRFQLTRDDNVSVSLQRSGKGYTVNVSGQSLDARALIRRAVSDDKKTGSSSTSTPISLKANVDHVTGFNDASLNGVSLAYSAAGGVTGLSLDATTDGGKAVKVTNSPDGAGRRFRLTADDTGSLLRFLNVYGRMQGGAIALSMAASGGSYAGQMDLRNFYIVNEPKLGSIVSSAPQGGNRSLNETVQGRIDTSRVQFERGYAEIEKGPSYLRVANGVLRGPTVGATFRGTVFDENGQTDLNGTFMPAYGLNRIFGELPLIGEILGNGRDRGLIGVTYKLTGDFNSPRLQINPLSVIAPGIFRSIFEFQ